MKIERLDYSRLLYALKKNGMEKESLKLEKAHGMNRKGSMSQTDYTRLFNLINKLLQLHLMSKEAKVEYQKELNYLYESKDILLE